MTYHDSTDTLCERLAKMLVRLGMQRPEASIVLSQMITAKDMESISGRWHDRADDFATKFWCEVAVRTKEEAVRWIDEQKPGHFARGALSSTGPDSCVPARPLKVNDRVVCDLSRERHSAPGTLSEGKVLEVAQSGEVVLYKINVGGAYHWVRPAVIIVVLP